MRAGPQPSPERRRKWRATGLAAAALVGLALVAVPPVRPAGGHPLYIGRVSAQVGEAALAGRLWVNRLDLLAALERARGGPLYELSRARLDSLTVGYLRDRLRAVADKDTLQLAVLQTGQERDEVWFDFAFPLAPPVELLALEVAVLFETFPDQRNLLELTTARGVHRHVFTPEHPWLVQEVSPAGDPVPVR
ncbi:MAG: DUF6702 family protein [Gemmatimonadota bacterium]